MASLIPMAIGQGAQNAQIRNQGGQTGWLGGPGAIDGSAQSFWNLGDPFNLTGKASSGHFLSNVLDPGNVFGQNQAANPLGPNGANAGVGATLPTLPGIGAPRRYDPASFGGFADLGDGAFNRMAAGMAGRVYQPQPLGAGNKGLVPNAQMPGKGIAAQGPAATPLVAALHKTQVK